MGRSRVPGTADDDQINFFSLRHPDDLLKRPTGHDESSDLESFAFLLLNELAKELLPHTVASAAPVTRISF
jgi:hypothetical protein